MKGFSPDKPVYAVVCILTALSTLVSGAIYHYYAIAFALAVLLSFFLTMTGRAGDALKAMWPAWAMLGVTYVSSFWSVNLNLSISQAFFLTYMVAFSYLAAFSVSGDRKIVLLRILVWSAAAVSVYGIYQYFAGFAHTEDYLKAYGGSELGISNFGVSSALLVLESRRAFSTMLSPNVLACFLAMVFPAGLALYFTARGVGRRVIAAVPLVLILAVAILTKSAGGLIAFFAGMSVYIGIMFASNGGFKSRAAVPWIAVALVVALASGYFIFSVRGGSGYLGLGRSFAQRLGYFSNTVDIIKRRPFIGSGAGTFQVEYFKTIKSSERD